MKLLEIVFACYVYGNDSAYTEFLKSTNSKPDLAREDHRKALLKWLNKWGCRQFALKFHQLASEEIKTWYEQFGDVLDSLGQSSLELLESEPIVVNEAYTNLTNRKASRKSKSGGQIFDVVIGPTGAAKILFAVKPNLLPPWDDAIRQKWNLDRSAESYIKYLSIVKQEIKDLAKSCEKNGYSLSDLPMLVEKPSSSLIKLVDEYFWMTITRKSRIPTSNHLAQWADWQ